MPAFRLWHEGEGERERNVRIRVEDVGLVVFCSGHQYSAMNSHVASVLQHFDSPASLQYLMYFI